MNSAPSGLVYDDMFIEMGDCFYGEIPAFNGLFMIIMFLGVWRISFDRYRNGNLKLEHHYIAWFYNYCYRCSAGNQS